MGLNLSSREKIQYVLKILAGEERVEVFAREEALPYFTLFGWSSLSLSSLLSSPQILKSCHRYILMIMIVTKSVDSW